MHVPNLHKLWKTKRFEGLLSDSFVGVTCRQRICLPRLITISISKRVDPAQGLPEFSEASTSKVHKGGLAVNKLISQWLSEGLPEDENKLTQ